jgi:hypothetical protein
MLLVMVIERCSEMEGSVVNLDLEESISWSFHFMIYKFWFFRVCDGGNTEDAYEFGSCVPGRLRRWILTVTLSGFFSYENHPNDGEKRPYAKRYPHIDLADNYLIILL